MAPGKAALSCFPGLPTLKVVDGLPSQSSGCTRSPTPIVCCPNGASALRTTTFRGRGAAERARPCSNLYNNDSFCGRGLLSQPSEIDHIEVAVWLVEGLHSTTDESSFEGSSSRVQLSLIIVLSPAGTLELELPVRFLLLLEPESKPSRDRSDRGLEKFRSIFIGKRLAV